MTWAAVAAVVEFVVLMVVVERSAIPPLIVIGVLLLAGIVLLRRPGPAGVRLTTIVLGLYLLLSIVFSGPDLAAPASAGTFALSWAIALTCALGLFAGVAAWRHLDRSPLAGRLAVAAVAVELVLAIVGLVVSAGYDDATAASSDVVVRAQGSAFVPATLTARAGHVSLLLDNRDPTLHNMHISGGPTKTMPAHHRTRMTAELAAGSYTFKCDFHSDMKGTLTVT